MAQVNLSKTERVLLQATRLLLNDLLERQEAKLPTSTMLSAGERIESSAVVARVLSEIQELLGY